MPDNQGPVNRGRTALTDETGSVMDKCTAMCKHRNSVRGQTVMHGCNIHCRFVVYGSNPQMPRY